MKTLTSIRAMICTLILISLACVAYAQETSQGEPATTKGAVIKGKAPVNRTVLKVKLPRAQEATLKNGLRIVVLERNKIPTFSMELVVLGGGLSDAPGKRGLAGVTAALLREGTAKHNSREIAEQLDTLGATVIANSGLNSFTTNINGAGLIENFDQVLGLFAEVIRTPSFPADELEKYKSRTTSLLQGARSQAVFLAQERLAQAIYGDHPAGTVSQPVETLKKLTTEDLARFHAANYLPNNSILFVVGDVRLKEVLPKIEAAFGDWKSGPAPQLKIREVPLPSASRIQLINRPGSVQTVFQIGALGITRTDPDYAAFAVMNRILGGGASSRLFLNIREDKGYAYSVGSTFNTSLYRGTFIASSPVRTEVTEGALREFMNEFKRIREEQVSPAELDNAKRAIVGQFALTLENPQSLLQNIITQKLYNLPADYWDLYPRRIEAITAADVQRIAQVYIDLPHLQIIAVGDAAKTRDVLVKFGHLDVYDTDGKLVAAASQKTNP